MIGHTLDMSTRLLTGKYSRPIESIYPFGTRNLFNIKNHLKILVPCLLYCMESHRCLPTFVTIPPLSLGELAIFGMLRNETNQNSQTVNMFESFGVSMPVSFCRSHGQRNMF